MISIFLKPKDIKVGASGVSLNGYILLFPPIILLSYNGVSRTKSDLILEGFSKEFA